MIFRCKDNLHIDLNIRVAEGSKSFELACPGNETPYHDMACYGKKIVIIKVLSSVTALLALYALSPVEQEDKILLRNSFIQEKKNDSGGICSWKWDLRSRIWWDISNNRTQFLNDLSYITSAKYHSTNLYDAIFFFVSARILLSSAEPQN